MGKAILKANQNGNGFTISLNFSAIQHKLLLAQTALDAQVASDMEQYIPISTGNLRQQISALNASKIGTGELYRYPPASDYGHYQWQGELYVDPITGKGAFYSPTYGFWSRPGVEKVPSGKPLKYTDPMARDHWDEVALAEHGKEWLQIVEDAFAE